MKNWNARTYDAQYGYVWKAAEDLLGLLEPKKGERILDIGCGTGHLTAKIAAAGAEVTGLDRSPDMIRRAREQYPNGTFVQGDARRFTFPQPFDALFSNAALHWIRE